MQNVELKKIDSFSGMTNIPICVYDKHLEEFVYATNGNTNLFLLHSSIKEDLCQEETAGLIHTYEGLHFGRIEFEDYILIAGPNLFHSLEEKEKDEIVNQEGLKPEYKDLIQIYLSKIQTLPLKEFKHSLMLLYYYLTGSDYEDIDVTHQENECNIETCLDYIASHIDEKLTLEGVANNFGYNPSYFSRKFKQVCGMNFSKYLLSLRISKGAEYLRKTKVSLAEISARLYFSSQSHFHKAFKEIYGVTPSAYRKSGN